uniref:Uncharacterized protein n=1 Tax=Gopherus agassizii TaxID=38772 RepID=A0A452GQJ2_9SAUR
YACAVCPVMACSRLFCSPPAEVIGSWSVTSRLTQNGGPAMAPQRPQWAGKVPGDSIKGSVTDTSACPGWTASTRCAAAHLPARPPFPVCPACLGAQRARMGKAVRAQRGLVVRARGRG